MKMNKMEAAVEAILFASGEPLESDRIAQALEVEPEYVTSVLKSLGDKLSEAGSGICLVRMEDKYQLCTDPEYAVPVRATLEIKKNTPLSNAAFEVLAVVAYNQPVTKAFIEQVRGVDCSGVIQNLILKGLVEERGRLELPGRPLVYGTTPEFLKCFCVSSLDDLPDLPEHEDLPLRENIINQLEINFENGEITDNPLVAENIVSDGGEAQSEE